MNKNLTEEIKQLSNEELLELYNDILEHLKFLDNSIINMESEGTNDEK